MFKIGNIGLDNKIVLAPLAGYTDSVYRQINKEMGVGLVYTEMISAKGINFGNDRTIEMTKFNSNEKPVSLQLFGGEVDELVKAARFIEQNTNADILDINMGCPVRKVLKSNAGSFLLQNPDYIYEIVSAVISAVDIPITVKIRAGWDHNHINCVEVAQAIEKAGASAICVHGRTKTDLYRGTVNLDYIKMVKDSVNIPVIGNGDIKSVDDAIKMFEYTNVDAVMVGRGSFGNPWLIRDLVDYFNGEPIKSPPSKEEKISMLIKHFEMLLEDKGEKLAILQMRSLAAWYVKGLDNNKEFKQKLVKVNNKLEFYDLVEKHFIS